MSESEKEAAKKHLARLQRLFGGGPTSAFLFGMSHTQEEIVQEVRKAAVDDLLELDKSIRLMAVRGYHGIFISLMGGQLKHNLSAAAAVRCFLDKEKWPLKQDSDTSTGKGMSLFISARSFPDFKSSMQQLSGSSWAVNTQVRVVSTADSITVVWPLRRGERPVHIMLGETPIPGDRPTG